MSKSDWRIYVAMGFVSVVAVLIGIAIWPTAPQLKSYSEENSRPADYRPGDRDCEASVLAKIAPPDRTRKTDSCRKDAEDYRLSASELVQQTRAASAAEAQANVASQGLWIAWFQTVGGFITLCAAVAAAFWAAAAAKYTKKGVDVSHRAERAFLHLLPTLSRTSPKLSVKVHNYGRTYGNVLNCVITPCDSLPREKAGFENITAIETVTSFQLAPINETVGIKLVPQPSTAFIRVEVHYMDIFDGKCWTIGFYKATSRKWELVANTGWLDVT